MRAAVFYDKKNIKVEDVPQPSISSDNDVKIKVSWCGICGSDMEEYLYGPVVIPEKRHPLTNKKLPLILGHEFCGKVVSVGDDVSRFKIGDKVIAHPIISCGNCYWCKHDVMCLCEKMACIGLQGDGAFAEYVVVPQKNCYQVKENEHFEYLALTEPTATAYRAVQKLNIHVGENILILGGGTIGLLALQIAKLAGANVIVLEVINERIRLAKELGAYEALNPLGNDIKKEIEKITDGKGVSKIIECVGNAKAAGLACDLVNKGGTIVLVGISPDLSLINTVDLVRAEKKIIGVHGYDTSNFEMSFSLINEGRLDVKKLVTNKIYLENIVEDGFEELAQRPEKNIKILVTPDKKLLK